MLLIVAIGSNYALFFERLGSTVKTRTVLPGFFHDTLGERDRGTPGSQACRVLR